MYFAADLSFSKGSPIVKSHGIKTAFVIAMACVPACVARAENAAPMIGQYEGTRPKRTIEIVPQCLPARENH
jgi:hypothetical protein